MSSDHRELGSSLFGSEPWQPIRTRATIAVLAIAVSVVADVVDLIAVWRMVNSYAGHLEGSVSLPELQAAIDFADSLWWPVAILSAVAGIAFLAWMWRAYTNAKFFGGEASQRRTQGWVVFGWILPVVNLWFPYQMMSDIWRASPPVRLARTAPIVGCWWAAYLGTSAVGVGLAISWDHQNTYDPDAIRILSIADTALSLVAGVLIIVIINRITAWQNEVRDPN